jgi:hypothetical protein
MWGVHVVHHHAAPVRVWLELGVCVGVTAAVDDSFDEAQIQPAHDISVILGDDVERTVS